MNFVITGLFWAGRDRLAESLAARIGGRFIEGPALLPAANQRKRAMRAPWRPEDYRTWLDAIGLKIVLRGQGTVITCAALRAEDRVRIRDAAQGALTLVQIVGTTETRAAHMATDDDLPDGTAETFAHHIRRLEIATPEEKVLTLDLAMPREQMINAMVDAEKERLRRARAPRHEPRCSDPAAMPNA